MKKIGIIVEYNPLHNGHIHHLNEIKKRYPHSLIICVMSGNFTQRGNFSVLDKWRKTALALQNKIDLVVEYPFYYAIQASDHFAYKAVEILNHLCCETIIFGSENLNANQLYKLANIQLNSAKYTELVQSYLQEKLNYPRATAKALKNLTAIEIAKPNELLGLAYAKAVLQINDQIAIETITRTNDYHSTNLDVIASATSIRIALENKNDFSKSVPQETFLALQEKTVFWEQYFLILKAIVIRSTILELQNIHLVEEGIEYRIKEKIMQAKSFQNLIELIKTKRYTHNRIQRTLLCILLNFTKEAAQKTTELRHIRVLGFSKLGQQHLKMIKKQLQIPIITNLSNNTNYQTDLETNASQIYHLNNNYNDNKSPLKK